MHDGGGALVGALVPAPAAEDAKTESFLASLLEPHCGHFVPFQVLERTRISLSAAHCSQ